MTADSVSELIGNTPLVRVRHVCGSDAIVYAKLEYFNPGGSVKDRIAAALIDDAEKRGLTGKDAVIVEPTSGNTGIGLAMICAVRGYRLVLTMPDTVSSERRQILAGYGAELVLTPGSGGMAAAVAEAEKIAADNPDAFIPGQFSNPANPAVHEEKTAVEILKDTGGTVDILVAGVGTGGTVSGTARGIKSKRPGLKVIAVEPEKSPVISMTLEGKKPAPGPHAIQGIGAGFIPGNLDLTAIDQVVRVSDQDAIGFARRLMQEEGIFGGISAGAAACAAARAASEEDNCGKTIVFIVPDTGERYLSQQIFA